MKLVLVCSHSLRHNYGHFITLMFVQNLSNNKPRVPLLPTVLKSFSGPRVSHLRIETNEQAASFNYTDLSAPSDELCRPCASRAQAGFVAFLMPDNSRQGSSSASFY